MTETRYTITGSGNPGVLVSERADGQRLRLTGYGAVFYNPSDNGTSYQLGPNIFERISPECFKDVFFVKADNAPKPGVFQFLPLVRPFGPMTGSFRSSRRH